MEDQKKYELTLEELHMLIGIGASCMCDEHDPDILGCERIVIRVAAGIAARIERHLTGKCEFPQEAIDIYKATNAIVRSLAKGEPKDGI